MDKEALKLGALTTGLGALIGGYAESCTGNQECWQPTPHKADPDCRTAPLPPSCVGEKVGHVLMDIPAPAMEHPEGAAVGAGIGLFSGMVLAVLANRLNQKHPNGDRTRS